MEKQLTAMQELLKWSEYRREKSANPSKASWNMIIDKIKDEMIVLEKQTIKGIYLDIKMKNNKLPYGMEYFNKLSKLEKEAEKYYNNSFKQ